MPAYAPQTKIAATYMRGGTSKGVFFRLQDLPAAAQVPGPARDALLLRVIGSPDPYGTQIDGMGGATSSTSKVVIVARSDRRDHDVDYLFGQVALDRALIDWSGNCGNLSAAVGPFAIANGLVDASRTWRDGVATVRIWQANIGKTIVAHVPIAGGAVQEAGDFALDGVAFPAAEVRAVGRTGTESRAQIDGDRTLLDALERIRAAGALRMGLIGRIEDAANRPHTPKLALVAPPAAYVAADGRSIGADEIDLLVRGLSMGKLHHAMMGTAAVAIAAATAVPGTLLSRASGAPREAVRFGHPSGTLRVGAEVARIDGEWTVQKVLLSRSARVLMEGWVRVPEPAL
ncbi:MAG TPA: PrpF domain-containing protein [Steroidobacteraceae bacterium]|nr:PrpF domain-containing protein [Steroidobacteraceae bacterium]